MVNYTEILIVLFSLKQSPAMFDGAVVHHKSSAFMTACGGRPNSLGNVRAVRLLTAGGSCVLFGVL